MIRFLAISILLLPLFSFSHWEFMKVPVKSDLFQSHVFIREVPIGKNYQLAAVIQNSRVSSKLYPDFSKVQPDDVARYLLKPFSKTLDKEMLETVSLYRAQTEFDHIRVMVRKRKNDFLISFAFVKRTFLYRSYNETDFFQRLFIAVENKKSFDGKTSGLFNLPALLASETAHAAGFSSDISSLIGSIKSVASQASIRSLDNFSFAAQNLEPGLTRFVNSFESGLSSIQRAGSAIERIPNSTDRLSGSINDSGRAIERGLNNLVDPKKVFIAGIAGGVGIGIGTMFSNLVASGINLAFGAIRDVFFDMLSIYKDGEKESILKDAANAWREYDVLSAQMYQHEKELQDLEIALQLASGKSIEEIFNVPENKLSRSSPPLESGRFRGEKYCSSSGHPSLGEIENLRGLAEAIKNNPEVKKQLCARVDRNMDMIEKFSSELTTVRTRLSNSMLETYNKFYEDKLRALKAPGTVKKAVKECQSNAETEIKADELRYNNWNCSRTPEENRCLSLKTLIEETKRDAAKCSNTGEVILARDDAQYIRTRTALRESKNRMDAARSEFLLADCAAEDKEAYCNGKDGTATKVKKAYNVSLLKMKADQCPDLNTSRFNLPKDVYHGNLPVVQNALTPNTEAKSSESNSSRLDTRSPTSDSDTTSPAKENFIAKGLNAFWSGIKSLFSWFGK